MKFEILGRQHDRNDFDCGVKDLNYFLQKLANQQQKRELTRVHVLADGNSIIGFYTLSPHAVKSDNLPRELNLNGYSEMPVVLIGRLAVDKRHQSKGYGQVLVIDAFNKIVRASETMGIIGIIVDAKDDKAHLFYENMGFMPISDRNRLIIPLIAVRKQMQELEII